MDFSIKAYRNVDRAAPQAISRLCGLHWREEMAKSRLWQRLAGATRVIKTVLNPTMKPAAPPVLRATRLLNQVRERIRYKHYILRTEQAYV